MPWYGMLRPRDMSTDTDAVGTDECSLFCCTHTLQRCKMQTRVTPLRSPFFMQRAPANVWASVVRNPARCSVTGTCSRALYLATSKNIMATFKVSPIPLFDDNYCWRIDNPVHGLTILVDPADARPVASAIRSTEGFELSGILTTHFHHDHAGGNAELAREFPGIAVVGGELEDSRVPAITRAVKDGDVFELGELRIRALHTPCHTRGHMSYYIEGDGSRPPVVFTGDTLFVGGCGKFFEGTALQMLASLDTLSTLPQATQVYCGHEYTLTNLAFCLHVEPDNALTREKQARCQALRDAGKPTVPSTIGEELATNVFMRCRDKGIQHFTHPGVADPDPVEVLAKLREAKNHFKMA